MELYRALGALVEAPAPEHRRLAQALGLPLPPAADVHAAVVGFQRQPYASIYLGAEGMIGGEVRDRVAGFRRALGLDERESAPAVAKHAAAEPDHLASLLSLLASLESWRQDESDAARRKLLRQAFDTLAWEYVLPWTPLYLASFAGCGAPFYEDWARLASRALDSLCDGVRFPDRLPEALRTAPAFPALEEASADDVIAAALAPVRCGALVLRSDLALLAEETGMAFRAGERRSLLRSFLAREPGATLGWLAGHARRWAGRARATRPRRVGQWWAGRAEAAARTLDAAAADAEVAPALSA